MHRVSIIKGPLSMYLNVIKLSMMLRLMLCLFQENKSDGVKSHLHSSSDVHHCTSQETLDTLTNLLKLTHTVRTRVNKY